MDPYGSGPAAALRPPAHRRHAPRAAHLDRRRSASTAGRARREHSPPGHHGRASALAAHLAVGTAPTALRAATAMAMATVIAPSQGHLALVLVDAHPLRVLVPGQQ